jgi:tetratricopeptide (TPR) repeat protein
MLRQHRRELAAARKATREYPDELEALTLEVRALAALGRTTAVAQRFDLVTSSPKWRNGAGSVMLTAGMEFLAHEFPEAARDAFERAITWHRSRPAAEQHRQRAQLAWLYLLTEQNTQAEAIYRTVAAEQPDELDWQGMLAVLAILTGDRAEAERIAQVLATIDRPYLFGEQYYWRAVIAAQLGRREDAVALLSDAMARGRSHGINWHRDILLVPLRDYAPFKDLLRLRG